MLKVKKKIKFKEEKNKRKQNLMILQYLEFVLVENSRKKRNETHEMKENTRT